MPVPTFAPPSESQESSPNGENSAPTQNFQSQKQSTRREGGITFRVVALCLVLAVFFGYIIPIIDFKLLNTFLGATHLPPGAIATLLVLVLVVNPLLRLVSKKWAFSRNEALTVYISCLFSCVVPGHGAENLIVPVLIAPFYYATRENRWLEWIQPHIKPWLTPALDHHTGVYQKSVVEDWFLGNGGVVPWSAWLVPLLAWSTVILAIYMMLACLSVMLRAQWAEYEALSFPLLRLPLTLTEDLDQTGKSGRATPAETPFFRNPLMWMGFGVPVFIQMLRGLHLYFPDVPNFPMEMDLGGYFSEAPWNQVGWTPLQIFPIVVGVTFLLTTEVSLSLWFFYWFMKFQLMGAYYLGFTPNALPDADVFPGKAFLGFQTGGAYLAYVAIVLWTGREHFRHIARRAFGRARARPGERDEALSYPLAFWGFVLTFFYILAFTTVAGVRFDVALALWVSYLVFAIGLTRIAVEGGVLFLLHDVSPLGVISRLFGAGQSTWLNSSSGIVPASFVQSGLIYHMRGFSMPSFVQSFKLAHDQKIPAKPLLGLISAVTLISLGMSLWMVVRLGYENGALSMASTWSNGLATKPATFIDQMSRDSPGSTWTNRLSLLAGFVLTYGMMLARSRFLWFPLHPLGYLLSMTFVAHMFWFSFFLGWLCKILVKRFGGQDTYRKLVPTFLGLALGDVTMMIFWLIIDGWQGRTGHVLMPS